MIVFVVFDFTWKLPRDDGRRELRPQAEEAASEIWADHPRRNWKYSNLFFGQQFSSSYEQVGLICTLTKQRQAEDKDRFDKEGKNQTCCIMLSAAAKTAPLPGGGTECNVRLSLVVDH